MTANPRLLFFIGLVSALALVLYRDREKVQRHSILFYRRTKHGIEYIDRIAKSAPRFWNIYGWTGVVVGFLTIPTILYLVLQSFSTMVATGGAKGGPSLLLPGINSQTTLNSGISFVPVEYWVISIGILMFVHEMSHGIIARAEGMEINSVGWIVLGIIPGAFVEPKGENMLPEPGDKDSEEEDSDDEQDNEEEAAGGLWNQGSTRSRLKVLAAGSFANYLTALVFAGLALLTFTQVAHPVGITYIAQEGYPAQKAGMDNGTIYSIENERVRYFSEMEELLGNYSANQTVKLNTSEGVFHVDLTERNGSAYLGIWVLPDSGLMGTFSAMVGNQWTIKQKYEEYRGIISWTLSGLQVVALLNFLIGMFNLLPVKPLDGGQMVSALLEKFYPEGERYMNYWSLLAWAALITALVVGIIGP